MTRQQIRAQLRADAFVRVTTAYGLEPRRARRGIARAWATKEWRKRAALLTVASGFFALLSIGVAMGARAQGTRKDDIVLNAAGRPEGGATVRICASGATGQPCTPLANIYSDLALTQPLANPTTADGLGNYSFYAAPGLYEIEISGPGITPRQFPNVLLPGSSGGGGAPGGSNGQIQSNCSGVFCGGTGATYDSTNFLIGGAGGVLISGTSLPAFSGAPTVTPSVTGSTTYVYLVQARRGNLETSGSAYTTITNGYATLDSSHTNTISWSAVAGATSYDVYDESGPPYNGLVQRGFIGNTTSTSLIDNGSAVLFPSAGGNSNGSNDQGGYLGVLGLKAGVAGALMPGYANDIGAITSDVLVNPSVNYGEPQTAINGNVAATVPETYSMQSGYFTVENDYPATCACGPFMNNMGVFGVAIVGNATGSNDGAVGGLFSSLNRGLPGGTITHLVALATLNDNYGSAHVGTATGILVQSPHNGTGSPPSSLGLQEGIHIQDQSQGFSLVSTPSYGLYIDNQASGTNPYSIYSAGGQGYHAGKFTFGGQIISSVTTGTAPLSIASTTPVANLTLSNHPTLQSCGTTTTCSHSAAPGAQIVYGSAALSSGTPSTASVTGFSPAFASSSSFLCTVSDTSNAANNLLQVVNVSASSITITGPNSISDTINYICVGN